MSKQRVFTSSKRAPKPTKFDSLSYQCRERLGKAPRRRMVTWATFYSLAEAELRMADRFRELLVAGHKSIRLDVYQAGSRRAHAQFEETP